MQRLTGLDAGFLYTETPSSAMHVAGLCIYEPSDAGVSSFEQIREMVRSRLHLAPPFRRRLVTVPFQLHHPLWIEDPDFDLDWHIRRITVPAPGGRRELADLAAHLTSLQLDRSRPLWEMWVIEGLDDGNVATLTKVHHAAIDGASGNQITMALLDLTAETANPPVPETEWKADPVPSDIELVNYAVVSLARQPVRVVRALRRTIETALNIRQVSREQAVTPPLPFSAPSTSINGAISPARSYAMTSLSLDDVKTVKNAYGVTVNDVVLAMCAGSLRHYFDARGERPDRPLVAMVPVSVRTEADKDAMGNQVSSAFASLATDIDDPVVRLLAIHESMAGAKEQQKAVPATVLQDWAEFAAPAVFSRAARLYSRTRMADRHRPVFNVTISNVPGPPFPLWSAGSRLVANYPLGPVSDGLGLNITVMSYRDQMDFGLLASPELISDVWSIAEGLEDALQELLAAAERPASRSSAPETNTGGTDGTAGRDAARVADVSGNGTTATSAAPYAAVDEVLPDTSVVNEGLPNQALVAEQTDGPPKAQAPRVERTVRASARSAKTTARKATTKSQAPRKSAAPTAGAGASAAKKAAQPAPAAAKKRAVVAGGSSGSAGSSATAPRKTRTKVATTNKAATTKKATKTTARKKAAKATTSRKAR